jgi:hypothetical protein
LDGLISQQQVGPEFPELLSLTRLKSLITVEDFEAEMQKRVTKEAFEYVSGGAGGGLTLLENRAAFDRLRILPRALIDATYISTKTELFGRMHEFPILLAPAGYNMLMHPRGELEAVEGANLGEATMCAANFSNFTIEEISAAASRPPWFQLYVQTDRGFTKELVARALTAGCEAICVTVTQDFAFRPGFSERIFEGWAKRSRLLPIVRPAGISTPQRTAPMQRGKTSNGSARSFQ